MMIDDYTEHLILVLWDASPSRGMPRVDVLQRVKALRKKRALSLPEAFENAVQSAFDKHAAQSSMWRNKIIPPGDDLFYSPDRKEIDIWAVHRDRARSWLRAKYIALYPQMAGCFGQDVASFCQSAARVLPKGG
jgi:hypothetical protein